MSKHNSALRFSEMCYNCGELFKIKNNEYGDSIWVTGLLGATVELIGAVARLPKLVLRAEGHGRNKRENIKDVLMDIHNYAAIALIMLDADNWEGETNACTEEE